MDQLNDLSNQGSGDGDELYSHQYNQSDNQYDNTMKDSRSLKKKNLITDLNQLIYNKIKKFTDNSFVYLKYTVPTSSEFFTPYSLVFVV